MSGSETAPSVRLELLGEMIRRLQADVRPMRDETKLNQKLLELHTERIATHEAMTARHPDQAVEITFAIADKPDVESRR
jgi:hypothetical protein